MRLLVIGGTQFFGRALVEAALERGDAVTVLSRGERRPPFWDRIVHIAADRRDQAAFAAAVGGREFDAVVDNIAFTGQHVQTATEALAGATGHYILTSTGSVYRDFSVPRIFRPVAEEEADLTFRGELAYGNGKREGEQVAREQQAVPYTIIRPPIVQGPHDASLRGWFWYQRVADGGPVLVPTDDPASLWRQAFSRDLAQARR
jgi:nucleoside-diphosphate-sugar epimerase